MIRHAHGNEFRLFTQDDHAKLSGVFAGHVGNAWFAAPEPRKAVIDAIALHDCGWPLHDDQPTLNEQNVPLHVFEPSISISVRVWAESVRQVLTVDSYSALLVSLHVFNISALSYRRYEDNHNRNAKELFEINKFQQLQIEIQEQIRREKGMMTDTALQLGLAPPGSGTTEDALRGHYHLLRAMDQLSLSLLCSGRAFTMIEEVSPRPGADPIDLRVHYLPDWTVSVSPWPFAVEKIEASVPFRRVPKTPFANVDEFRGAYAAATKEYQTVRVVKSS